MLSYLQQNIDITHLSNYKTPARSRYFFEVNCRHDVDKIFEIQAFAKENNIPFLIIGWGSNMLFAFEEFPGVILKNNLKGWEYNKETCILNSKSQEKIRHIAHILEEEDGQTLWHRFIGLPGSIGGAVYGNAGCFGLEIEGNFLSAEVLDLQTWKREVFQKKDMEFSYRTSRLKKEAGRYFLLSVSFDLSENREKYASTVDNIYFREHQQPKGNSCGSFFKNPVVDRNEFLEKFPQLEETLPERISAGYLIEQVGLKGYYLWGAYFSELHANFLMHNGEWKYEDLLELISLAQEKVYSDFGISLENEVQIISIN